MNIQEVNEIPKAKIVLRTMSHRTKELLDFAKTLHEGKIYKISCADKAEQKSIYHSLLTVRKHVKINIKQRGNDVYVGLATKEVEPETKKVEQEDSQERPL